MESSLHPPRHPAAPVLGPLLILLMGLGSILMWLGAPLGWVLLASHLSNSSQPSLGPYMLVLFGVPVSMVVIGKFLVRIDTLYARVTGAEREDRHRAPWLRSMRDTRQGKPSPRVVLDIVMVVSVALAMAVGGVWFFFFAGSSLPGA